ncbi:MAG: hypothetical protein SFT93_06080 [Rickettsiaceae bacterium]|nr:hypothetical protein [Rickettsiaceae bacterium]
MQNLREKIKDFTIYLIFLAFVNFMRLLGIDKASYLAASIMRIFGPWTKAGQIVRNNLRYVYTNITKEELKLLEQEIWDNFGRYLGEFAYLDEKYQKSENRVYISGIEIIDELKSKGKNFILFSGHFANWDYVLRDALKIVGECGVVYRKVNNKYIDKYLHKRRSVNGAHLIQKGPDSGLKIARLIKEKKNLLMLVDQKMNQGVRVKLMDRPANTATGPAMLALRYSYNLVPVKITRVKGRAEFALEFLEPLVIQTSHDPETDIVNLTIKMNDFLTIWIKENPGLWLWQHQRWGKPHEML